MGALRVGICGGGEDVFTDEQVGGDEAGIWDPAITVFDYRYEVMADHSLAVIVGQKSQDRRYSPDIHPVASVEVTLYRPSEWESVSKD